MFKGFRLRHRYHLLCPPETGGTRSEATEGVDSYRHRYRYRYRYRYRPRPCPHLHHAAGIFTCRPATINRGKVTLTSDLSLLTAPQVH